MSTNLIRIKAEFEGENDIREARQEIQRLAKAEETATKASEEFTEATKQQAKATEQTAKETEEAKKKTEQAKKAQESFGNVLASTANKINILGVGLGDVGKELVRNGREVGGFIKSLKLLRVAMIALPIGALVVAISSLTTFFTRSERGANAFDRVLAAVGATIDVVLDRFASLGEAIFSGDTAAIGDKLKGIFIDPFIGAVEALGFFGKAAAKLIQGDFAGAVFTAQQGVESLKGGLNGLIEEIVEESKAAVDLEADLQAVVKAERELLVERAKQRAAIKTLNKDAEDTTLATERRAEAARKAIELETNLQNKAIAIQAERLRILRAQNELGESNADTLNELAEAEADLFNIQTESEELITTLQNKYNILLNLQKRERDARFDVLKIEEESLKQQADNIVENANANADKLFKIEKDKQKKITDEAKRALEERQRLEELAIEGTQQIIGDSIAIFSSLYQSQVEQFEVQKQRELRAAGDNADARAAIEAKFEEKVADIRKKQAQAEKAEALFNIAISTAENIARFAGNPILAALAAAVGATQAAIVARTPIPEFADGVIDLQGHGTDRSDQIPAMLSRGESVIPAMQTRKYRGALDAIYNESIDPALLNGLARGNMPQVIDATKTIETARTEINIDERGFMKHYRTRSAKASQRINRYKTLN